MTDTDFNWPEGDEQAGHENQELSEQRQERESLIDIALATEQMLAMEAGPKLDALVAEKVMRWHSGTNLPNGWFDGRFRHWKHNWQPSIDHNHAMEVAEKAWGSTGSQFSLTVAVREGGERYCTVNSYGPGAHATAPTMPLAICRAALLAVETTEGTRS